MGAARQATRGDMHSTSDQRCRKPVVQAPGQNFLSIVLRPCWAVKAMLPRLPWFACVIILATPVCSAELPNHARITHKPTDFV